MRISLSGTTTQYHLMISYVTIHTINYFQFQKETVEEPRRKRLSFMKSFTVAFKAFPAVQCWQRH